MSATSELEEAMGHAFRDRDLLARALTHSSVQKKSGDNERLEFLGDRVLALVVADMLYRAYPEEDEGRLALRHTGLVQRDAIAAAAAALGLARHIRLSMGERKAGGHAKDNILADAFEALIGAVWLDGGYGAAEKFVVKFWQPALAAALAPPQDPKTALQEWAQARGLPVPAYREESRSGPEHAPVFEIVVEVKGRAPAKGKAASKRAAEKAAAQKMLDDIGETT